MGPLRSRSPRSALPALLLAAVLLASACTGDDGAEPTDGTGGARTIPPVELTGPPPAGTLRMGLVGPEVLDPAFVLPTDQSALVAADLLWDGLTAWDPVAGTAVAALAEGWAPDASLTTWTFTLRPDATFADGTPVTAADVKASLERIVRLGNISLAGVRLDVLVGYEQLVSAESPELVGVEAVDDRTVVVRTTEAYAPLPALLSAPVYGIVPASTSTGGADGVDAVPTASGPYAIAERDGATTVLEAVGDDGAVPTVELIAYPDDGAAYDDFTEGLLDWSVVPAGLVDEAGEAYGRDAIVPFLAELLYGFDLADPALADPRLRLAASRAVDRQALLDEVLESAVTPTGLLPPGVPGAVADACGPACAFDPVASQALLAEAFPDGDVPTLRLDVFADPVEEAVAARVAEDLRAVGIPVDVVATPFDEYRGLLVSDERQLFTFGWVGVAVEPDVFLAPLFLSSSPDNVTGLADPVTDLALRVARAEPDAAARNALYAEIDRQVMGLVPMIPLAVYETAAVLAERVEGYVPRPDGTFVVTDLRLAE